jgi:hypothetical protein
MSGSPVEDAVTLNLPRAWWSLAVTAGYCLALVFSYPLMFFPALRIIEDTAMPYFMAADALPSDVAESLEARARADAAAASARRAAGGAAGGGAAEGGGGEEAALPLRRMTFGEDAPGGDSGLESALKLPGAPVEKPLSRAVRNAFRAGVVAISLLVAFVGSSQLDNFVALVGCFCCTPLAFI